MKTLASLSIACCLGLAAAGVAAQDKMSKDAPPPKPMTMQECNDYMAMVKKDATKKDAKKDAQCTEMMKAPKK
jgi:hypothetical protein